MVETLSETALVVLVPQAERLVSAWRDEHDPSAALGVPAHVTLLYPFLPIGDITHEVLSSLHRCFRRFDAFDFRLTEIRRFSGVLYLVPEPAEPFRAIIHAIWRTYPDYPPYGGRHEDVVPHLCVAQIEDEERLNAIEIEFSKASCESLPVSATAVGVTLLENRSGRWHAHSTLPLGGGE